MDSEVIVWKLPFSNLWNTYITDTLISYLNAIDNQEETAPPYFSLGRACPIDRKEGKYRYKLTLEGNEYFTYNNSNELILFTIDDKKLGRKLAHALVKLRKKRAWDLPKRKSY